MSALARVVLGVSALARVVLGVSGLAAAALALLPALVAALIALFDLSAHALLGTSGSLLGVAGGLVPVGGPGRLAPYARIEIHPWRAALLSLARGVPPAAMVLAALRPAPFRRGGGRAVLGAIVVLALLSDGVAGAVAAAPGLLAIAIP